MFAIIKNNWNRLLERKLYLMITLALTICSILFAVIMTGKEQPRLHIAVSGRHVNIEKSENVQLTWMKNRPAESELVQGHYDALVTVSEQGKIEVQTIKNNHFRKEILKVMEGKAINGKEWQSGQSRRIGTNIIGYMFMFLMMQGMLFARLFAEDKEHHQTERIICAPISFHKYLTGHALFGWMFIVVPSFLILMFLDICGFSIGFTLWQYAILLTLIGCMAVCFALCVNAFVAGADTANMVGNSIIVMSSILGGTFYDMSSSKGITEKILYAIPQKDFMKFVGAMEYHTLKPNTLICLIYVILITVAILLISIRKTSREYEYHRG